MACGCFTTGLCLSVGAELWENDLPKLEATFRAWEFEPKEVEVKMTDMVRVVTNSTDSFAEEKTFKIYKIPVRKVFISSAVSNYSHKSVQNRTLLLLILFVLFGLGHRFFFLLVCLFIHSYVHMLFGPSRPPVPHLPSTSFQWTLSTPASLK
jgi:hypothetical protein